MSAVTQDGEMTPVELAAELDVQPIEIRRFLRREFPRSEVDKGSRWQLTPQMTDAVRRHFRGR